MDRPVLSFLSDFGARDPSAAICRGVIIGMVRDAQVIDITHEVRKYGVRDGAFLLANALPHLPVGVHIAVVDPGVGTDRRPIAIRTARGDLLVGPDNGLLAPAAEHLGGIIEARELTERSLWLPTTTATFHGRDVFAPVAGHLAAGVPFERVGPAIDPATLVRLPWPGATAAPGRLETAVLYVDSFGNVKLGGLAAELRSALGPLDPGTTLEVRLPPGREVSLPWIRTFADVVAGRAAIYEDSFGRLSLAVNQGSAAEALGLGLDDEVAIRRAVGG